MNDVPDTRIIGGVLWTRHDLEPGQDPPEMAVIGINKETGQRYMWIRATDLPDDP